MAQALRSAEARERLREIGVPVIGKVRLRKEILVMVYVCKTTNLLFLVTLSKVREERRGENA